MSDFKNFIRDFPQRCLTIFVQNEGTINNAGLEVTFALMVASTGITIPYERLRPSPKTEHPSGDREKYATAANDLEKLLNCGFLESTMLAGAQDEDKWCFDILKIPSASEGQFLTTFKDFKEVTPDVRVATVLLVLRNALAHGNVYTRTDRGGQITQLFFVSAGRVRNGHRKLKYVCASPALFRLFLLNWFNFVSRLKLPSKLIAD
jgi:hypothetical protein